MNDLEIIIDPTEHDVYVAVLFPAASSIDREVRTFGPFTHGDGAGAAGSLSAWRQARSFVEENFDLCEGDSARWVTASVEQPQVAAAP